MCECTGKNKPDTLHNVVESLKEKHGVREPHIHADVIKAWADGAEIESSINGGLLWRECSKPHWFNDTMYRIKPEPKPLTDLEKYGVEVGDVWCGYCPVDGEFSTVVQAVGSNQYVGFTTGARISKELLTDLVFRRGVVNKFDCM